MFCPVCKTEYGPGQVECGDCHVALAASLPEEGEPSAYAVLWKGENVAFATKLVEELSNAGIAAVMVPLDVLARNSRDFLDVAENPLFGSAVSVTTRDYPAAERIKNRLLEEEPGEDQAGLPESSGTTTEVRELPLHWDPATATVEVWRGTDFQTLTFAADALHGVGIPTRRHLQDGGNVLLVRAEDADRALEIVSEVLEGRPPA